MAFPPHLPPEILHSIVTTYLSPTDDTPTLHALSLTHSFFIPSTRAILFHTIRLARHHRDDGVHPHLCSAFSALLHRSPYIAQFVRKLIVIEGTIRNSWFGHFRYWVSSEDEELPFILRMVAYGGQRDNDQWPGIGLRSLEVLGFGKATMDWESFQPQLRRAFVDMFELGRLEDLRLVGLNHFPLHILRHGKHLRNICFGWMETSTPEPNTGPDTESEEVERSQSINNIHRPALKFLDLSFEHDAAQGEALISALIQPSCPIDISRLEHIVINGDQHLNIQHLFDYCHDELKFLEIRTNEYPIPSPPTHISLRSLSALHCLSLFVPVIDWDEVSPKPFPWLDHLLSTLQINTASKTSNPSLHTLQLIFDIDRIPLFERINQTEWSNLNNHLTRLLKSHSPSPFSSSDAFPYTPSLINTPDAIHTQYRSNTCHEKLEITIYIFTDLDSYMGHNGTYASSHCAFLKDPMGSYSSTSCQCGKSRSGQTTRPRSDSGRRESTQMRKFLTKFLPVLATQEGIDGIRVYRINYIPRL
ncbi:hypothetical protein P691DRAFT_777127 [Macrolepiota fuliginosa MF-IS2]|uniref:Uncharacterized protein n=1 Tax=Macrolepiota fuliginosa MF-IS2 TaxID=1400762 RepID=A0A9P5X9X0_9AGAR|nr:hypothetical protein P691DRAFT_777127 [Macrolepiota fuliginosa MF-IS2]